MITMKNSHANALRAVLLFVFCLLSWDAIAAGPAAIEVSADEQGTQRTGQSQVLHDPEGNLSVDQAVAKLKAGHFAPLQTAGSTGLKSGAYWSYFKLHNPLPLPLPLHLEYVDHQLISLDAYGRTTRTGDFATFADLSMERPFSHRLIEHNRFIVPLELAANETREMLIRFGSRESGYAYPSMRIWSPESLANQYVNETNLMSFLFGGFFLMSLFALVAGVVSRNTLFYVYSLYAFSKIICWATILGYTHQYLLRDHFHWSLMSSSGALTIILGLVFARRFLQTRQHTPRLDRVVLFMIANAGLLLIAAIFQIKPVALITITLALLLYPVVFATALLRWRQGQAEAGIFALAWSFLVIGLLVQALRDLGLVELTLTNYYWPPVASFSEMLTIMFAMGLQMRRLYQDKKQAERQYREHLEQSKSRLEDEVKIRTRELEEAKCAAELEARTDPLTGILNRRSFVHDAALRLKLARRQQKTCCLLMFDLDHFKRINDTCGHNVGDKVLCQFTETISRNIRETDVFGRLGGEEFALIVEEPREAVYSLVERLRADIAHITVPTDSGALVLTTSIGLAFTDGDKMVEDLLIQADQAMYQAKVEGRNRFVEALPN